eukprot:s327_g39.t1
MCSGPGAAHAGATHGLCISPYDVRRGPPPPDLRPTASLEISPYHVRVQDEVRAQLAHSIQSWQRRDEEAGDAPLLESRDPHLAGGFQEQFVAPHGGAAAVSVLRSCLRCC